MSVAHAMCELPLLQTSTQVRAGSAQRLAQVVATAGLVLVILGVRRDANPAWLVAAWTGAAYWFAASTSFANPAITLARSLTDTFAGIRLADVPGCAVAQLVGGLLGWWLAHALFEHARSVPERRAADYFVSKLASQSSSEPAFKSSNR